MQKILLSLLLLFINSNNLTAQSVYSSRLKHAQILSQLHPDSALIELRHIHTAAVTRESWLVAGESLQQMGQICFNQGHYAQSLDFYLRANKIFSQIKNKNMLAANMSKIGTLYYYNKQLYRSRGLCNKAFMLYKQTGNLKGQAEVLGETGHLFEKQQQYDSAFYYQKQALNYYNQINYADGAAKIYENLGSIYEDLAKYDSAYTCFMRSKVLYEQEKNVVASIEVINNLGDVLRKTGRYTESLIQSHKAFDMATKTDNLYHLAAASRDLGKTYKLLNELDSAYHYIELSRKYSLEVYSKEGINQTAFLQVLYDINKKSDEIARLNTIRKTNRIIGVAVVACITLLIVLAIVIFSRQRLKLQDQKILAEQNQSILNAKNDLMQLELKNKQLEEHTLKQQLNTKTKELSVHTLNLIKNNKLLEDMRNTLQLMVKEDKRDQKRQMQQIIYQINQSFDHEHIWTEFNNAFEQVHYSFFEKLKQHSSDLTATDMRLVTLLKVNMESKDIAGLLGISMDSLRVARHRLRKKLNIEQGDNLSSFIQSL